MYQRRNTGYIEQQIEAIALVLARIIGLKDAGKFDVAQVEVATAFQNVSGLSIATVLALPESMAVVSFRSGNQIDAGKALVAAMLLEEHANVAAERNLLGSSEAALRRALLLYAECVQAEESLHTAEYEARILGILERIGDESLTSSTIRRLGIPF